MKTLSFLGTVGLVVHLLMNLCGRFLLHRTGAEFFSETWYETWFPGYVMCTLMLLTSFVSSRVTEPQTSRARSDSRYR